MALSSCEEAPVHRQDHAVDVRGFIAGEEYDRVSDLGGRARPTIRARSVGQNLPMTPKG
jgi:hypothetical protein